MQKRLELQLAIATTNAMKKQNKTNIDCEVRWKNRWKNRKEIIGRLKWNKKHRAYIGKYIECRWCCCSKHAAVIRKIVAKHDDCIESDKLKKRKKKKMRRRRRYNAELNELHRIAQNTAVCSTSITLHSDTFE